jgi:hypothetical protein
VIDGQFKDLVSAETAGFSHGDFGLVVETLHDAAYAKLLEMYWLNSRLVPGLLFFAMAAHGGTIYSTGGGANPTFNSSTSVPIVYHCPTPGPTIVPGGPGCSATPNELGYQFIAAATGTVNGIEVALSGLFNGGAISSGSETFDILADSSGSPGALLDSITITGITGTAQVLSGNSTLHPLLTNGTTYWLQETAANFSNGETDATTAWYAANPAVAGNRWEGSSTAVSAIGAFAILTPAPEPSTFMAFAVGLLGFIGLRRAARRL